MPDSDAGEIEIRAVGPMEETFGTLRDEGLGVAVEAAADETSFVFVHPECHVGWTRPGRADPPARGAALT